VDWPGPVLRTIVLHALSLMRRMKRRRPLQGPLPNPRYVDKDIEIDKAG